MNLKQDRVAPLEMNPDEFRALGHQMVDQVADFFATLQKRKRPVTHGESPTMIRDALGTGSLPQKGTDPKQMLERVADLLFDHSLFNGHARFWGYITSSAAPIGALGDLLAAAVNPNVGAWFLSPMASEIEAQTIRWIAELLGFPADCGGLLVSGGNMANFVCFLAARQAKAGWDVRKAGMTGGEARHLRVYGSKETHTWIQKAADMFGVGTDKIRWVPTDDKLRMDTAALRKQIQEDLAAGDRPIMVVGAAGSVSTGAVDPLPELAAICREYDLWFHVDGAYGGCAAALPDASPDLKALSLADSAAVDPHKWLYTPIEAGCALVRDPAKLREAFAYHPPYYHFGVEAINYLDYGPQNTRGFRALKVWLAQQLYRLVSDHPELQAFTQDLSITTFRYVPRDLKSGSERVEDYLNQLNREVLTRLHRQLSHLARGRRSLAGDRRLHWAGGGRGAAAPSATTNVVSSLFAPDVVPPLWAPERRAQGPKLRCGAR